MLAMKCTKIYNPCKAIVPFIKVPMKWNFSPLFYFRKLKSMLHWFIIFEFKLWSGAQNNFSIPPKLAKNAIVVFWGLELVTS